MRTQELANRFSQNLTYNSTSSMSSSDAKRTVLAYWTIRGLAEPIRYLLTYCNVDFEVMRVLVR
jgi:hypothetical protein